MPSSQGSKELLLLTGMLFAGVGGWSGFGGVDISVFLGCALL
jgi:hypothetical protein